MQVSVYTSCFVVVVEVVAVGGDGVADVNPLGALAVALVEELVEVHLR